MVKQVLRFGGAALAAGVLLAAGLAGYGIWSRGHAVTALQARADDASVPRVEAVSPKRAAADSALTLPGQVSAWNEAQIYGQVSGYIAHWHADYGAHVKAGDVLATIDTPSLDAQYEASQGAAQGRAGRRRHRRADREAVRRPEGDRLRDPAGYRQQGRRRPGREGPGGRRPAERRQLPGQGGLQGHQGALRRGGDGAAGQRRRLHRRQRRRRHAGQLERPGPLRDRRREPAARLRVGAAEPRRRAEAGARGRAPPAVRPCRGDPGKVPHHGGRGADRHPHDRHGICRRRRRGPRASCPAPTSTSP